MLDERARVLLSYADPRDLTLRLSDERPGSPSHVSGLCGNIDVDGFQFLEQKVDHKADCDGDQANCDGDLYPTRLATGKPSSERSRSPGLGARRSRARQERSMSTEA